MQELLEETEMETAAVSRRHGAVEMVGDRSAYEWDKMSVKTPSLWRTVALSLHTPRVLEGKSKVYALFAYVAKRHYFWKAFKLQRENGEVVEEWIVI